MVFTCGVLPAPPNKDCRMSRCRLKCVEINGGFTADAQTHISHLTVTLLLHRLFVNFPASKQYFSQFKDIEEPEELKHSAELRKHAHSIMTAINTLVENLGNSDKMASVLKKAGHGPRSQAQGEAWVLQGKESVNWRNKWITHTQSKLKLLSGISTPKINSRTQNGEKHTCACVIKENLKLELCFVMALIFVSYWNQTIQCNHEIIWVEPILRHQ